MSKKCLSLVLVLSMVLQLCCMIPSLAADAAGEPVVIRTEIINDTFDDGLGSWVYGPGTVREGSLDWDENGYMVLTRTSDGGGDTANTNTMVKADRDFADVALEGNKIVIETRVKSTGNESGTNNARLRMNLPVEEKYITYSDTVNYLGWAGGTLAHFSATDSTVKYKSSSYGTATFMENVAADEWVNAKIVIDGTDGNLQNYTITAWKDNDEANAVTTTAGTLKEFKTGIYDAENFLDNGSTDATMYTALKSLNFTLNDNASSITVDYIKAYSEKTLADTTASIVGGILVDANAEVQIQFNSETAITSIPDGSVTIADFNGSATFNPETKVLTFTPLEPLTAGKTYTVSFDKEALQAAGINLIGKETLSFQVAGYGVNYFINDEFNANGDLGNWKLVYGTESGKNITFKQSTLEDGTGVMELAADRYSSETTTSLPTISSDFKDIDFAGADEIVIETRFMATGGVKSDGTEGNTTYLKFNQPEDKSLAGITPPSNGGGYLGSQGGTLIQASASAVSYKVTNGYTLGSANDNLVAGEWINAKIVLRPNEGTYGMYTITTWEDGDEANAVTKTDGVLQENAKAFYDPETYVNAGGGEDGNAAVTATKHTALKNLLFAIRQFSNTMYVDYIKGYAVVLPEAKLSATLANPVVAANDPVVLNLATNVVLTELPAGAFTVDGVALTETLDASAKKLMLSGNFTKGGEYTINVDKNALYAAGIDYTGEESLTFTVGTYGINYLINDEFNEDGNLGNWVIGASTPETGKTISLKQDTLEDGTGAMVFSSDRWSTEISHHQPALFNDFSDLKLDGNKFVIETRIKATGGTKADGAEGNNVYLKFNRPNDTKYLSDNSNHNYVGWNGGTLAQFTNSAISYKSTNALYGTKVLTDAFNVSDWVNVKIEFDATELRTKRYKMTVWQDGKEDEAVATVFSESEYPTLNEHKNAHYDIENYVDNENAGTLSSYTEKKSHEFLKSLTFTLRQYSNTLYVDYFKLYTDVAPGVKLSASVTGTLNGFVEQSAPVTISFESASDIAAIPSGAFTVDGVTVTESYDAEAKTLTLTPAEGWAAGTTYTINVDKDALYNAGIDYTTADALTFKTLGAGANYFLEDNFNTTGDIGNWKLVYGTEGGKNITLQQTTLEGDIGVMEFGADRYSSAATTSSPTISNDFADIALDTNKIVIETRVMSVGEGAKKDGTVGALNYLKFNQPEDSSLAGWSSAGGYLGAQGGTLMQFGSAGAYYKSGSYSTSAHDASLTSGNWINAKIVIDNTDGVKDDYTLTTWADGNEAAAKTVTGTMRENGNYYYNPELFKDEDTSNDQTRHLTLQNILFVIREYADTMYVDYVKAAIVKDFKAKATIDCGPSVEVGQPIKVKFDSEVPFTSVPADAVVIEGVETVNTFDADTQTISVDTTALTEGTMYKLTINEASLEAAVDGLDISGIKSFNIRARGERETGKVISDDFNDGTTEGWTIGAANDGYKAAMDVVDVDGEEGNKALKVTMSAIAAGNGNQPNITRVLGNGVEFKNGEWVTIKTRIKKSEGFNYFLKANRPDEISQVLHEYEWAAYALMGSSTKVQTVTSTGPLGGVDGAYTYRPDDPNGADVPAEWVTYTITFKPETGCYFVSAALDDGTVITNERVGAIYVAGTAIEKMFGIAPANNQSYRFLDSLTFIPMADNTGEILIDYINISVKNTNVIAEAALTVNGEVAEEITAGTTVKPSFTINPEDGVTQYTVISALYIDGILEDTHINPIDVTEAGFVYTEEDGYVIPSALEGKYEIKAFVWNTLDGMKPVSAVASAASAAND